MAVAVSVVGGLAASIIAAVFLIELPADGLPGIALGSEAILVIQRIALLFGVWLLGLVVIARALVGELPIEISGRGLRYADRDLAQHELLESRAAMRQLRSQVAVLSEAVAAVEGADRTVERESGYAVCERGGDGH
jgi:hypothetical protein